MGGLVSPPFPPPFGSILFLFFNQHKKNTKTSIQASPNLTRSHSCHHVVFQRKFCVWGLLRLSHGGGEFSESNPYPLISLAQPDPVQNKRFMKLKGPKSI